MTIEELYQANNVLTRENEMLGERMNMMKAITRKVYNILMEHRFNCPLCGEIDDCKSDCIMPQWVDMFERDTT